MSNWMCFVDGENFTIRGQEFAKRSGIRLTEKPAVYLENVFLWPTRDHLIEDLGRHAGPGLVGGPPIRSYYYTSVVGDEPKLLGVRHALRELSFDPQVFKKDARHDTSKGVDVTLTKDMLSHAFFGNYSQAVLVAGDADYVPLVQEVKRMGKNVFVAFFRETGLGEELRLAADNFFPLDRWFEQAWARAA